jgi:hypothetical protein
MEGQVILLGEPIAIIYVDGEEHIRCQPGDDPRALLEETALQEEWRELALMEWKPRHNGYLRTVLRTRGGLG